MNALVAALPQSQMLVQSGGETASQAVASQARALVEARYVIALKNPRDIDVVRERLVKECRRPSFAAVARYHKPIGKGVTGPSIRFAEAAIRCMGNITVETMTVYDDREKRIVRVAVTDLEANVPYSQDVTIDKSVERRKPKADDVIIRTRTNSYGEQVSLIEATEDDILNKQNALISKAVRTLGLRLVPGDLIDEAMWLVVETQKKADAQDPDAAKIRLFDSFGEIGIRVEQIKDYVGHDCTTLTPKEMTELRGLYRAINDGEATWAEATDQKKPKAATGTGTLGDLEGKLRTQAAEGAENAKPEGAQAKGGKKPKPEPAPQEPADPGAPQGLVLE